MLLRRTEAAKASKSHTTPVNSTGCRAAANPNATFATSDRPTPYPRIVANVRTDRSARRRGLDVWGLWAAHVSIYYTTRTTPTGATCLRADESEWRAAHIGAAHGKRRGGACARPIDALLGRPSFRTPSFRPPYTLAYARVRGMGGFRAGL